MSGRVDHVSRSQSKRKHTTAPRQQRHQKSMDVDWGFRRAGRTTIGYYVNPAGGYRPGARMTILQMVETTPVKTN